MVLELVSEIQADLEPVKKRSPHNLSRSFQSNNQMNSEALVRKAGRLCQSSGQQITKFVMSDPSVQERKVVQDGHRLCHLLHDLDLMT